MIVNKKKKMNIEERDEKLQILQKEILHDIIYSL